MVSDFETSKLLEYPLITTPASRSSALFSPSFFSIASDPPHTATPKDISLGLSGRLTTESLFSPSVVSWSPLSPKTVVSYDCCDTDHYISQQDRHLTPILADNSAEAALEEYSRILGRDTSQLFFSFCFYPFLSIFSPSFRALLSLIHCSRYERYRARRRQAEEEIISNGLFDL